MPAKPSKRLKRLIEADGQRFEQTLAAVLLHANCPPETQRWAHDMIVAAFRESVDRRTAIAMRHQLENSLGPSAFAGAIVKRVLGVSLRDAAIFSSHQAVADAESRLDEALGLA